MKTTKVTGPTLTVTDERRDGLGYAIRNRAGVAVAHVTTESPELVACFAAAPALLAACEAVLAWSEKHGHPVYADKCNEPGNIVRSALAQARGPS